jgi:3'-phosphoadenosine 5'-phosphosulfate sulfotransferase (PAPS reductase)/FAD synthetase
VLLDLARRIYHDIPAVFVDTGLEYPEIKEFVKQHENVTTIRPQKNFKQVILEYGYPVASKEISRKIKYAKQGATWAKKYVDGTAVDSEGRPSRYRVSNRWLRLMDAPFNVSDYCCTIMKKKPLKQYEKETGRKPIIATLATESNIRIQAWMRTGCNAFDSAKQHSKPMSFWTEQDILQYLKRFNVPYCSVYGDIVNVDENSDLLKTTQCDRTGCMFCMLVVILKKSLIDFRNSKKHIQKYGSIA